MAAVSVQLSPHAVGVMASRRVPLSHIPNVGNSPFRNGTIKRGRDQSNAEENTPPAKRPAFDMNQVMPRTPTHKPTQNAASKGIALDKRVQFARETQLAAKAIRQERVDNESQSLDTVRQWQRHYRKVFPTFVFYFENIPDDARRQCLKTIVSLGAREEKFFSREVTHVITTRSMPSDQSLSTSTDAAGPSSTAVLQQDTNPPHTINPSLLEKAVENHVIPLKRSFNFDFQPAKKLTTAPINPESRKSAASRGDILQKAKALGIKIWHLEKLGRVLDTIMDCPPNHGHNTRSNNATSVAPQAKMSKQTDLSQMIKNEKTHERGDREFNIATAELQTLSGPYVYVRDMNEKTKPIALREYPKVANREDGEWPQFRSVSLGKCPFIEEDSQTKNQKREKQKEEARLAQVNAQNRERMTRSRAAADQTAVPMEPPPRSPARLLRPMPNTNAHATGQPSHHLPPAPSTQGPAFSKPNQVEGLKGPEHRLIQGEPMASGMQRSNVTSAIRSQMISSTAPIPGAKAGTSKEIHGLQRKVFERNAAPGLAPSQRMTDIAGTAARMTNGSTRAAKQRAQERLNCKPETVQEDPDEDDEPCRIEKRRVKVERKEAKPGYCENCREKFEDFDTHIQGRKHRKFALDTENWKEIDDFLAKLVRPLRTDLGSDE